MANSTSGGFASARLLRNPVSMYDRPELGCSLRGQIALGMTAHAMRTGAEKILFLLKTAKPKNIFSYELRPLPTGWLPRRVRSGIGQQLPRRVRKGIQARPPRQLTICPSTATEAKGEPSAASFKLYNRQDH